MVAWHFLRLGSPNCAAILALALLPIVVMAIDAMNSSRPSLTRPLDDAPAVEQTAVADTVPPAPIDEMASTALRATGDDPVKRQ
jgi:hypothetical protein